ncbi:MAG TPA: flippase-like domain-containing protein, partial [Acidimicrobiales bacterium]|nr:flippase-like domain-containing protein [Acidimicrobiales bacterium]
NVQDVVAVGGVSSGDAVIVLERAVGSTFADMSGDALTDHLLEDAWTSLSRLHSARLANGGLELGDLIVSDERVVFADLSSARLAAPDADLTVDVAELLVATAVLVGPDRALAAARTAIGDERLTEALPFIQPAALTPALRDEAHDNELKVSDYRSQVAKALGVPLTPIAELRRVTLKGLLFVGLTAFAAWLIISQLADVGLSTIIDELQQASWEWLLLVLILGQLPLLSQALSLTGAVPTNIPYAPTVALESGIKFVNLTVPSSAGRIAVNIRYLQKQGLSSTSAVAAGALDGVAGTIVEVTLLLIILPFMHLDLSADAGSDTSALGWIVIAFVIAVAAAALVLIIKKSWRQKLWHTLRDAFESLKVVLVAPAKLVRLFGGNILTELGWAITLAASAHAYGADLGLAQALVVNMCASVFASVMPVPGGIGVAEASLAAGMIAFGVPSSEAYAAALTHRLATFYLPPIWGWFSLRYLTRKGYL